MAKRELRHKGIVPIKYKRPVFPGELQPEVQEAEPVIIVEDDRTGMNVETVKRAFWDNLHYLQGVSSWNATSYDYYRALCYTVRDRLMHRWIRSMEATVREDAKIVFYLSAEFLMGRQLEKNLLNVGIWKVFYEALGELGLNLTDLFEEEPEPGLGNGGLGRLAACFLDSLAALDIPAFGYGIRYEFGIFEQQIKNGWQVEHPDNWLRLVNPWEVHRPHCTYPVRFGGHTESSHDENGRYSVRWVPSQEVLGTAYDTLVPGFDTNMVNTLRLWRARATNDFDFQIFNDGDYSRAVAEKTFSENISKVLYPNDQTEQGKDLRLRQQYFFVSCALQDIIQIHKRRYSSLDNLHEKAAIQLNDTHPAIAVAELIRLLVDEHDYEWEPAWEITKKAISYTNHTLLAEALETWPVDLFERTLPRHFELICEINRRFLETVRVRYPSNEKLAARLSIFQEIPDKRVRMAHLATVGSHAVNGVAELHSRLLKESVMRDFYELWPGKFCNKTNGVTPRRWMMLANPKLSYLITDKLGRGWLKDLQRLQELEKYADDEAFHETWNIFKFENKCALAEYIREKQGIAVDPGTMFDIQVKRIHEYKRQLLLALYIIAFYNRLKDKPELEVVPRTFLFGGKAAPGYFTAKLIIKLINSIASFVNSDPEVKGRMQVVFLENFNVSLGERVYPAADLSEQISTAGKEASGTGNMKFALNGALTIGTYDGANIEIRDAVGAENFFLFGLRVEEIHALRARGYDPRSIVESNPVLKTAIGQIASGRFSKGDPNLFRPIVDSLLHHDEYMLLADFQAYQDCQEKVSEVYRDRRRWTRMSILNVARMGHFSSDRTIAEYCRDIWKATPVQVDLEENNEKDPLTHLRSGFSSSKNSSEK